jgi:membrane protease YdiL (CAAX protease family)
MLILAVIPWITLLVLRVSPALLGFTRKGALAMFGWGMLAGAVWRGISLGINTLWVVGATRLSNGAAAWVTGVALVPTIEEIFFRGYLGRTLVSSLGRFWGIVLQAILFSLHPGHWVQGWPHLISIFGFGLLAGWLVSTRGGLWSALGAHAFANALPAMLHMVTS